MMEEGDEALGFEREICWMSYSPVAFDRTSRACGLRSTG